MAYTPSVGKEQQQDDIYGDPDVGKLIAMGYTPEAAIEKVRSLSAEQLQDLEASRVGRENQVPPLPGALRNQLPSGTPDNPYNMTPDQLMSAGLNAPGTVFYGVQPGVGPNAQPTFTVLGTVGPDHQIHYAPGNTPDTVKKFNGPIYAGRGDFNSGMQTTSIDAITGKAHDVLQDMKGPGMYASINEGKLYVKLNDGSIKTYHFISGCGDGANNPGQENRSCHGPLPAGTYTIGERYANYRGTGFAGFNIQPDAGTNMHGRDGFLIHMAHWNGTWGCLGINPNEMGDLQATLRSQGVNGMHLTVGNTSSDPVVAHNATPPKAAPKAAPAMV